MEANHEVLGKGVESASPRMREGGVHEHVAGGRAVEAGPDDGEQGTGATVGDDPVGAIRCIREAGRSRVWLVVSDLNRRARSFYMKNAFEPLHPGPVIDIGTDRLTSTVMVREV